jgi:hypothetical protein
VLVNAIVHQVRCEPVYAFGELEEKQNDYEEKVEAFGKENEERLRTILRTESSMPLATILEALKPQQTLDKWLFNDANPWAAKFTLNLTIEEKLMNPLIFAGTHIGQIS